ncbi:MAG: ABC transporter substrate-binding protein, partial [Anaerolineae bacterium]|nr:ABC transporter substrate-binding protein [Anaerolineae bacterium]
MASRLTLRGTYRCLCRLSSLLLPLVFLLAACLPPPLPSVIKFGLVAPFEGRYRSIGYDAIYAARLAVREINAAGGVDGWQIELVAYDDRGDPDLARTAARNLAVDPDVVAVIGHYHQESTVAAQAAYADAGLPLIALNAWMADSPLTWSL